MVVIYTYDAQWSFIRSYEGTSEEDAIAKIEADDFKGHAIVQNEKKTHYHFK